MCSLFSCGSATNAQESVYDIQINSITGEKIDLSEYKGKKILFVNVASECGFTKQYTGLKELHQLHFQLNQLVHPQSQIHRLM